MDANAVLSATIGGKALEIFSRAQHLKFVTASSVVEEVRRYLPVLAKKKGLPLGLMEAVLDLLPLEVVPPEVYADRLEEANARIGWRDPADVPLLALAMALGCPVWSNDDDFADLEGVEVYTTAALLAELSRSEFR